MIYDYFVLNSYKNRFFVLSYYIFDTSTYLVGLTKLWSSPIYHVSSPDNSRWSDTFQSKSLYSKRV